MTILVFIVILSALVLIHEFGHFWVARRFGILVEEFGIGFPPRLFKIKRGETIYSINWLPIGGFVKLYGEDEAGAGRIQPGGKDSKSSFKDEERAFFSKPPSQKALVVSAGVIMNLLLTIVIFYAFFFIANFKTNLPLLTDHKFIFVTQNNRNTDAQDVVVSAVDPESPAEAAGMNLPVEMIAVNDERVASRTAFIETINKNKGKEVLLEWRELETGIVGSARVTPRENPPQDKGALGVYFIPVALLSYETPAQKVLSGIVHPINLMKYNFDVLGKLALASIRERSPEPVSQGVSGPVGIYSLVGNILDIPDQKQRILQVLNLAGLLSVSLAILNILPIPALDGGRLFFIVIEGVTRRKVNPKIESYIHAAGLAVLITLIVFITLQDILRLVS